MFYSAISNSTKIGISALRVLCAHSQWVPLENFKSSITAGFFKAPESKNCPCKDDNYSKNFMLVQSASWLVENYLVVFGNNLVLFKRFLLKFYCKSNLFAPQNCMWKIILFLHFWKIKNAPTSFKRPHPGRACKKNFRIVISIWSAYLNFYSRCFCLKDIFHTWCHRKWNRYSKVKGTFRLHKSFYI